MKRSRHVLFICCLALVSVSAAVTGCGGRARSDAPRWADWPAWEYKRPLPEMKGAFVLRFGLTGRAAGRMRIAFCVRDRKNYYFLELNPGRSYLGITELGVERPLATMDDTRLADLIGKQIAIERRELRISVLKDNGAVLSVNHSLYPAGGVAFGGMDSGLRIVKPKALPVGEIHFSDDFMRSPDEAHAWRNMGGKWSIKTIKNPGRSVNAFRFQGLGRPARAVTGRPEWGEVEFSAACRAAAGSVVGLYVAWRDPGNYYLFRWFPRSAKTPVRQIVRCVNGREEVVAESPGGRLPDQWYQVSFWYGGGWGRVKIDDDTVFLVADPGLTMGRVGLYANTGPDSGEPVKQEDPGGVEFDDVLVRSETSFMDDFSSAGHGRWTPHSGKWRYLVDGAPWINKAAQRWLLVNSGPGETAMNVAGDARWRGCLVSADIAPWNQGRMGLAFGVNAGADYYSAEWDATSLKLCKTMFGRRTTLASALVTKPARTTNLQVRFDSGAIQVLLDGRRALAAHDNELTGGRVALLARDTELARFKRISVQPLPPVRPLISFHETFAQEVSMSKWSSPLKDWEILPWENKGGAAAPVKRPAPVEARSSHRVRNAVCWHRARTPGDTRVELKLLSPIRPGSSAGLLAAGTGGKAASGYELAVSLPGAKTEAAASKSFRIALRRKGKQVAASSLNWESGPENVALTRCGASLTAAVGGREVIRWLDPKPLTGDRAGFTARACGLSVNDFNVYTRNVLNYTFQGAATDWRVAAGKWDIRSRWQCDPRWSFFSGLGDGLVAIWNKREFEGDLTLEFFAGIQMDRTKGARYEYASDLNATICADGKDLNTGYSFVFGGRQNTTTRLYRGRIVLAENPNVTIDSRRHHRHWYSMRITKRGPKLEMSVDGERVLSVTDPRPLAGKRIAIWTYDNGMMIGRVRVSAERISARESPDTRAPDAPACIYRPQRKARRVAQR